MRPGRPGTGLPTRTPPNLGGALIDSEEVYSSLFPIRVGWEVSCGLGSLRPARSPRWAGICIPLSLDSSLICLSLPVSRSHGTGEARARLTGR